MELELGLDHHGTILVVFPYFFIMIQTLNETPWYTVDLDKHSKQNKRSTSNVSAEPLQSWTYLSCPQPAADAFIYVVPIASH